MTPARIAFEFRRAGSIRSLRSQTAILGFDKPPGDLLKDRLSISGGHRRRLKEIVRQIGQRLFGRALGWVQRSDYFNTKKGQERGEVVCIDGRDFRILIGNHWLYLTIDGVQHSFELPIFWTESEIAAVKKFGKPLSVRRAAS